MYQPNETRNQSEPQHQLILQSGQESNILRVQDNQIGIFGIQARVLAE